MSDDVRAAAAIPEGSALVLLPKASDAPFLNLERPLFVRRALKVVLFCDHETTIELAERAPDFFDWISQHQECPPGPAAHAVHGLRAADAADEPILWTGTDVARLASAFEAAFPLQTLRWITPTLPYEELVRDILSAGNTWIACRPRAASHLRRFRWATAEAGRRSRVIVVTDVLPCPGYWPVHDRLTPFAEARDVLLHAGASRAGLLAALTGLEPEAVELARDHLRRKEDQDSLITLLQYATDPGAALARLACKIVGTPVDELVERRAAPPILRALAREHDVRSLRAKRLEAIARMLSNGEPVTTTDLGVLAAAHRPLEQLRATLPKDPDALGLVVEYLLRRKQTPATRADLAAQATRLGELEAADHWMQRARRRPLRALKDAAIAHSSSLLFALPAGVFYLRNRALRDAINGVTPGAKRATLASLADAFLAWLDPLLVRLEHLRGSWPDAVWRGNFVEAERLFADYHAVVNERDSFDRPLVQNVRRAYAAILAELQKDEVALSVLDPALALESRLSGVETPFFSALVVILAGALARTGRASAAEALLYKLLGPDASLPGDGVPPRRPDVGAFGMSPDTEEALALFLAQPSTPRFSQEGRAKPLRLLAEALLVQGRYEEAEAIAARALALPETRPPPNYRERWLALATLGRILLVEGRHREAHEALREAASRASADEDAYHLDCARILTDLARVERRMGEHEDAANNARRALDLYTRSQAHAERSAVEEELNRIAEGRQGPPNQRIADQQP